MCLQVLILLTLKKFEENRGEGERRGGGGGGAVQTLCFGKSVGISAVELS